MHKAQFAPIAPVRILQDLRKMGLYDGYAVMLMHDVCQYPDEYKRLLDTPVPMGSENKPWTIILDNSQAEIAKGEIPKPDEEEHMSMMRYATYQLSQKLNLEDGDRIYVCLPDTIGDAQTTIEDSFSAAEKWKRHFLKAGLRIGVDYTWAVVVQGTTASDVADCVDCFGMLPDVGMWCAPRNYANVCGSRLPLLDYMFRFIEPKHVHLFGMSNYITDDIMCAAKGVRGIDSANPLVLGWKTIQMRRGAPVRHVARDAYWSNARVVDAMCENICTVQEAIADGYW